MKKYLFKFGLALASLALMVMPTLVHAEYWAKNAANSLVTNDGSGLANADIHVRNCYIGLGTSTPCSTGGGGLSNALTSGHIFVGNGSNIATDVALTLSATPGAFSLANTGILTMPNADTSTRGLLSSTDWNTFNDKLTSTLANTKIFIGSAGNAATAQTLSLSATGGTFALAADGTLTMPNADATTRGLLTSTDWNTFNNKASSTAFTLAGVSAISTDATKSTYTMTSTIPVEFKTSSAGHLLYLDETNARVGIGHNAPTAPLDVKGVNTSAVLGAEMITLAADRDFSSDTGNWTGTNWTIGGGVATHTAGANSFTLNSAALNTPIVAGGTYLVTYTLVTTSSDIFGPRVQVGNATGSGFLGSVVGTLTQTTSVINASNTNSIVINISFSSAWEGTLDNISLKRVTLTTPTQILRNSDGSIGVEIRSGSSGWDNSYYGNESGRLSGLGYGNDAFGYQTLYSNTTGGSNLAVGSGSLKYNSRGSNNVGLGSRSLERNTTGGSNLGIGILALGFNINGSNNVAIGSQSSYGNESGSNNVTIGYDTGSTSIAYASSNNIFLGYRAGNNITTGADNNIVLGYDIDLPTAGGDNQMSIGNLLYATGLGATGTTVSTANFGISTVNPVSKLHIGIEPTASANYGLVSLGAQPFNGVTAGFFTGSADGTMLAGNLAGAFGGSFMDLQLAGVPKFRLSSTGNITVVNNINSTGIFTVKEIDAPAGQDLNIYSASSQLFKFHNDLGVYSFEYPTFTSYGSFNFASITGNRTYTWPDASGNVVLDSATQTLTNKRVTPRVAPMADATSFTPTADIADVMIQPNTQAIGTLTANAPTGTPTDGQLLEIVIKSTNVQTFSWNAIYVGGTTTALPTASTGSNKVDKFFFQYDAFTSKWEIYNAQYGY